MIQQHDRLLDFEGDEAPPGLFALDLGLARQIPRMWQELASLSGVREVVSLAGVRGLEMARGRLGVTSLCLSPESLDGLRLRDMSRVRVVAPAVQSHWELVPDAEDAAVAGWEPTARTTRWWTVGHRLDLTYLSADQQTMLLLLWAQPEAVLERHPGALALLEALLSLCPRSRSLPPIDIDGAEGPRRQPEELRQARGWSKARGRAASAEYLRKIVDYCDAHDTFGRPRFYESTPGGVGIHVDVVAPEGVESAYLSLAWDMIVAPVIAELAIPANIVKHAWAPGFDTNKPRWADAVADLSLARYPHARGGLWRPPGACKPGTPAKSELVDARRRELGVATGHPGPRAPRDWATREIPADLLRRACLAAATTPRAVEERRRVEEGLVALLGADVPARVSVSCLEPPPPALATIAGTGPAKHLWRAATHADLDRIDDPALRERVRRTPGLLRAWLRPQSDRSSGDPSLAHACAREGLSREEIARVVLARPAGKWAERGGAYAWAQAGRVVRARDPGAEGRTPGATPPLRHANGRILVPSEAESGVLLRAEREARRLDERGDGTERRHVRPVLPIASGGWLDRTRVALAEQRRALTCADVGLMPGRTLENERWDRLRAVATWLLVEGATPEVAAATLEATTICRAEAAELVAIAEEAIEAGWRAPGPDTLRARVPAAHAAIALALAADLAERAAWFAAARAAGVAFAAPTPEVGNSEQAEGADPVAPAGPLPRLAGWLREVGSALGARAGAAALTYALGVGLPAGTVAATARAAGTEVDVAALAATVSERPWREVRFAVADERHGGLGEMELSRVVDALETDLREARGEIERLGLTPEQHAQAYAMLVRRGARLTAGERRWLAARSRAAAGARPPLVDGDERAREAWAHLSRRRRRAACALGDAARCALARVLHDCPSHGRRRDWALRCQREAACRSCGDIYERAYGAWIETKWPEQVMLLEIEIPAWAPPEVASAEELAAWRRRDLSTRARQARLALHGTTYDRISAGEAAVPEVRDRDGPGVWIHPAISGRKAPDAWGPWVCGLRRDEACEMAWEGLTALAPTRYVVGDGRIVIVVARPNGDDVRSRQRGGHVDHMLDRLAAAHRALGRRVSAPAPAERPQVPDSIRATLSSAGSGHEGREFRAAAERALQAFLASEEHQRTQAAWDARWQVRRERAAEVVRRAIASGQAVAERLLAERDEAIVDVEWLRPSLRRTDTVGLRRGATEPLPWPDRTEARATLAALLHPPTPTDDRLEDASPGCCDAVVEANKPSMLEPSPPGHPQPERRRCGVRCHVTLIHAPTGAILAGNASGVGYSWSDAQWALERAEREGLPLYGLPCPEPILAHAQEHHHLRE